MVESVNDQPKRVVVVEPRGRKAETTNPPFFSGKIIFPVSRRLGGFSGQGIGQCVSHPPVNIK